MTRSDEICVGGYQGHDQLDPADSLAGELRQDPLDAGYSSPGREPPGLRIGVTGAEEAAVHILDPSENGGNGSWPAEQDPRAEIFG